MQLLRHWRCKCARCQALSVEDLAFRRHCEPSCCCCCCWCRRPCCCYLTMESFAQDTSGLEELRARVPQWLAGCLPARLLLCSPSRELLLQRREGAVQRAVSSVQCAHSRGHSIKLGASATNNSHLAARHQIDWKAGQAFQWLPGWLAVMRHSRASPNYCAQSAALMTLTARRQPASEFSNSFAAKLARNSAFRAGPTIGGPDVNSAIELPPPPRPPLPKTGTTTT